MGKSIAKNFLYNVVFQMVTLLLPLITVPYISRIIGKEGIGVYSYTLSITQYFIILGTLGIALYGNRQIAYVRDNKEKMSKNFWSIAFLQIIGTSIALIFYMIISAFDSKYSYVYMIQSINIIAAMFDISWLYMGLEDFKKTVTRNLAVKILGIICIFIFVKSYDDLYIYIALNALMILFGNLVMWMYVPKTVSKVKIKFSDIKEHLIPSLKLFIPQIAIQIYVILDKSILGILANTGEVGLYDQAQKIVKVVLGLVTSLGVVMLPRMSNTFANGDNEKMSYYLNKSLCLVAYVSIPMAFGLASISKEFVPWFFGAGFEQVIYLIIILAPILFFIAMSNVLGVQYLLPTNKTKEFTTSVTVGAVVDVIFNLILIPKYKAVGACVAILISEFSVTFIQYLYVRKNIKKKYFFSNIIVYIAASSIMFGVVRIIGSYMGARILTNFVQGIAGTIIYVSILIIFKDEINSMIFNIIFTKIRSLTQKNLYN